MDSRNRTRAMVESALITAIAVVFTLAGIFIPLLSYALIFLPVPFIVIGAKHGIKYNILSVLAASIIIGSMTEPLRAVFVLVIGGFISIVMGYMIEKKYGFKKTITFGVLASIISSIVFLSLISIVSGVNIKDMIEQSFTLGNEFNEGILKTLGANPQQLEEINLMLENAKTMAIMLIPSSVIFGSAVFAYLNYLVAGVVLKRFSMTIEKPGKFSQFTLPRHILMGSILLLMLTFFTRNWEIVNFETLFNNVFYILLMVYVVQGLAVVSFYLEKKGFGKAARIIILILFFIIPSAALILMFLGLFDIIFNIRKLEI